MKRLFVGMIFLANLVPMNAWAEGWEMVGKNPLHESFVEQGPSAPFKRAWLVQPHPESSFTTWPVVKDGVVYASSGPGVIAIDASTAERRWFVTPEEGQTQVAPALGEGVLYLPLPFGRVIALAADSGRELWRFQADDELDASPTVAEGRLYFGSERGRDFYCLEASSGRLLWKVSTEGFYADSIPAVSQGLVVFSTQDPNSSRAIMLALDAATGAELWRVEQEEANSSPSILGSSVVFGGGDFFAYALDLKTGREIWKSPVEDKFSVWNMPAIAFGDVFLADRIGNIYRLDGETGKRKWIFTETEGAMDQSFPVIAGKTLFIGSDAGALYALDVDSGRLLWKDSVQGIVLSGAADSERFYFGVKFGDEGLYAYEHDPEGRLEPPPGGGFRLPAGLLTGVLIFFLLFGGFLFYARRRRSRAA